MLEDLFPVEVAVLGVDHDPIQPEGHRHLGHTGRFQRHPQPVNRFTGRELFPKLSNREGVHTDARIELTLSLAPVAHLSLARHGSWVKAAQIFVHCHRASLAEYDAATVAI